MKTLLDIPHLEGVKVLLRADFNVPILNGKVVDDFRIRMTLPTIEYLRGKGAKIIMVSHLESVSGENPSLEPVAKHLETLDGKVVFVKDYKDARDVIENGINNGESVLLENLRFFDGEKTNDPKFAQELASLADIYVNDAFSVSHREHASVVGVPKYIPGYAGIQLEKEVAALSKAFNPTHPFLFILGGAKFETKLPLLQKFISIADMVFVGGALANDFYRQKGYEIGTSLVSKGDIDLSVFASDPKIVLPIDVVNQNKEEKPADGLSKEDKIMDSGAKTLELLKEKIAAAKFILWNGPLGLYEDGYRGPTLGLAKLIADATENSHIESVVGGGDTLAAISTLNLQDKFTFISTGGGAMLDFLALGTLPGIEALSS
jgi:phosphoglycerate kinase